MKNSIAIIIGAFLIALALVVSPVIWQEYKWQQCMRGMNEWGCAQHVN